MKIIFLIILFTSNLCFANKNEEVIDFRNIKDVLKQDMLEDTAKKKNAIRELRIKRKKQSLVKKYDYPSMSDIWTFLSEYWLVQNAQLLKWDFQKPQYGIENAFRSVLETIGFYEINFKILLLDTPSLTHFSLPANDGEYLFVLSIPFIRTMDLSKLEISVLLLEDFLRSQKQYFKNYVLSKKLKKNLSTNFYNKKFDLSLIKDVISKYSYFVFNKGYTFQQQFEISNEMSALLKSNMKLYNSYVSLLGKIDNLVKTNVLYKKYAKMYPSPEIQLKWILPKAKKI